MPFAEIIQEEPTSRFLSISPSSASSTSLRLDLGGTPVPFRSQPDSGGLVTLQKDGDLLQV